MTGRNTENGFTLIEALVALAIIGIAAVGLVRTAEAHVDSVRGLELRAAAGWVAENRLAELMLNAAGSPDGEVAMLDHRWRVTSSFKTTDDPDLRAVHIAVALAGTPIPIFILDGFVDNGTITT